MKVSHYGWNGEYLWNNLNGSHHFGVAYHHAINGIPIEIPATITTYTFNMQAYSEYCQDNSLWVMNKKTYRNVIVQLEFKIRYGFYFESYDYPMSNTENIIVQIYEDRIGLRNVLYKNGLYIQPFHKLFM